MAESPEQELLKLAQEQLELVSKKIEEALPRTRRKRTKKVKIDGPILAEDLQLEAEDMDNERR